MESDDTNLPLASRAHLRAYYSLLITGSALHLLLLLFTLASRNVKKHAVVLNFYFIFCVTLWFDAILLWTNNLYNPSPPMAIQTINAATRLPGMVMNASTTLMCVVKFWATSNIALSTRVSKYIYHANSKFLVAVPYLLGIPFLIAYIEETVRHPEIVFRTPFYASVRPPSKLIYASTSVSLALMAAVVVMAVWLVCILSKVRATQRGLLKTNWAVNVQLVARLLLFFFYAFASIALHIRTLAVPFPTYEPRNEELFASIGIIAFALFFIQADILAHMGIRLRRNSLLSFSAFRKGDLYHQDHLSLADMSPKQPPACVVRSRDKDYARIEYQSTCSWGGFHEDGTDVKRHGTPQYTHTSHIV